MKTQLQMETSHPETPQQPTLLNGNYNGGLDGCHGDRLGSGVGKSGRLQCKIESLIWHDLKLYYMNEKVTMAYTNESGQL